MIGRPSISQHRRTGIGSADSAGYHIWGATGPGRKGRDRRRWYKPPIYAAPCPHALLVSTAPFTRQFEFQSIAIYRFGLIDGKVGLVAGVNGQDFTGLCVPDLAQPYGDSDREATHGDDVVLLQPGPCVEAPRRADVQTAGPAGRHGDDRPGAVAHGRHLPRSMADRHVGCEQFVGVRLGYQVLPHEPDG